MSFRLFYRKCNTFKTITYPHFASMYGTIGLRLCTEIIDFDGRNLRNGWCMNVGESQKLYIVASTYVIVMK